MGATLVNGGATFRAWGPRAAAVDVNGIFGASVMTGRSDDLLMLRDANGYWSGFIAGARDGDPYRFYVVGTGSIGYKRDPYAREMARDADFPNCSCLIRSGSTYPWHDSGACRDYLRRSRLRRSSATRGDADCAHEPRAEARRLC